MTKWNSWYLIIIVPVFLVLMTALILFFVVIDGSEDTKILDKQYADSVQKAQDMLRDSVKMAQEAAKYEIYPKITYKNDTVKTAKQLYKLLWKYRKADSNMAAFRTFTTLNRKELRFMRIGSSLVIPDTVLPDLKAYSLFPQFYPGAVKIPKLIMVSNRFMCYGCYEYGKLVRFAACNPGKERTPSYPGRYSFNWKERYHRSSIDSDWVMPFTWNFHIDAGSAFHQFDMPGYPASHSCIRQFAEDAEWLFYWGRGIQRDSNKKYIPLSGTPVIIIDYYNFNKDMGRLWTKLSSNKDSLLKLPREPMTVDEALIPMCQIPEVSRPRLRNKERYVHAEDSLRKLGVIRAGVKLIETVDFNKQKRLKAAKLDKAKRLKEQKSQHDKPAPASGHKSKNPELSEP